MRSRCGAATRSGCDYQPAGAGHAGKPLAGGILQPRGADILADGLLSRQSSPGCALLAAGQTKFRSLPAFSAGPGRRPIWPASGGVAEAIATTVAAGPSVDSATQHTAHSSSCAVPISRDRRCWSSKNCTATWLLAGPRIQWLAVLPCIPRYLSVVCGSCPTAVGTLRGALCSCPLAAGHRWGPCCGSPSSLDGHRCCYWITEAPSSEAAGMPSSSRVGARGGAVDRVK